MNVDDILKIAFLIVSGITLLFGDPILWVAWPVALVGIFYAGRIRDSSIIILCGGVPLAVAVGYVSLILSVVLMILLIVSAIGSDLFLERTPRLSAMVLIIGSILLLIFVPLFDPFIGSFLILCAVTLFGGLMYLAGHAVRKVVRGEDI